LDKSFDGKVKLIAIIGSLAVLAFILSPTFSALSIQEGSVKTVSGAETFLQDEVIEEDTTVVENISDEDLAACTSLNKRTDAIIGVDENRADDKKVASDTLIAEFCARPVLIHEIMSMDHAPMGLIAYACDASLDRIGTAAIQDSLSDHRQIYCDSARRIILNETDTFLETIEEFRTSYLPLFQAGLEDDEDELTATEEELEENFEDSDIQDQITKEEQGYFNTTRIEIALDELTNSLEQTRVLVEKDEYYSASKAFDNASKKFIELFQDESES
jgi:hypothetical protein